MAIKKDGVVLGTTEENSPKKSYNVFPKIISVVLAFILWFYVMTVESPVNEEVFRGIPIEVMLPAAGDLSLYSGYNATVDVTVSGKRSELNQITAEQIKAVADATTYTQAGKHSIPVEIELPDNIRFVDKSISLVTVYLGAKATASVPIQIKYDGYSMGHGLEFGTDSEVKKNPGEIFLSGPRNILETITTARVSINCGVVTSSFEASGKVELIDAAGEVVTNPYVTAEPESVVVSVPVFMSKEIELKVDFKNGYLDSSNCDVELSPSHIRVRGPVETLSKLDEYVFHTINEKTLTSESLNVPLELPEGVKCVDGTENVDIGITHKGSSTKSFTIEELKVENPQKLKYTLALDTVNITLRGKSEDISEISAEDITLSIDLSEVKDDSESITLPIKVEIAEKYSGSVYELGEYNMVVTFKK